MRVRATVSANLSGFSENPGARIYIKYGIAIMKTAVTISKISSKNDIASPAKSLAFSLPSTASIPANMGTKAELKAPSANNLRRKLGSLNATKNASERKLAPNADKAIWRAIIVLYRHTIFVS